MTRSDNSTDLVWLYNEFLVYFGLKLTLSNFLQRQTILAHMNFVYSRVAYNWCPGSGLYINFIVHFKRLGSRHIQKEIDIS